MLHDSIMQKNKQAPASLQRMNSAPLPAGACFILWQYRIILSADTAIEVRQMLSQKRR